LFLSKDKSPRQERTEILTKKLAGILTDMGVPSIHPKKPQGEINANWEALARVHVVSRSEATVLWNIEVATKHNLDRVKAVAAFKDDSRASPAVQWSSS
jgi:hypothetical protein